MKLRYLVLPLVLCLITTSCSGPQKILAEKPVRSNNPDFAYKTTSSMVSMPLEITLTEIEKQLNKTLAELVYEDPNLQDDNIQMKIWKTAPIRLQENQGKIKSVLPLKIWVNYKYGTDFLGLNDTKEFDLNGVITLSSQVQLSNWKLSTQSIIEDIAWQESPTMTVAGKKVPITYLISPALSLFKKKIAQKIDEAITKSCDFKPYVLNVLETLSNPILTSETYQAWFKLQPNEVQVTDAILDKTKITMNLGLKCGMTTWVGQQPKKGIDRESIGFKSARMVGDKTVVSIAAITTYDNASKIITGNFKGQEFKSGSREITVQNVELWGKDGRMIIALDLAGSLNGTIYLSGIPKYDAVSKEIYFEDMDYVLNTKGILTKTANWLLQGYILRKIQAQCRYSIQPNMEEGKKNLLPYLNNYSPMKGVFVNGSILELDFDKIELTDDFIIAFINGSGKMNVRVDGMD